ncbi:MAG: ROK family protein [Bacillota bacterium]
MKSAIGIDIGGTNTKIGLLDEEGNVNYRCKFATSYLEPEKIRDDLIKYIDSIINNMEKKLSGIGIASAGRIDFKSKKIVYTTDNLKDWAEIPITRILEKRFNIPVFIDNDVNAALYHELKTNEFDKDKVIIFLTIGTGLGGAVAIKNKLIRGNTGSIGEFGHMILYPQGILCNCGKFGCAEQYISGKAYKRRLRKAFNINDISYSKKDFDVEVIQENIKKREKTYFSVLINMIDDLVILLENLKNCLDFDICIIGGGFSYYQDLLIKEIEKKFERYSHKYTEIPVFQTSKNKNEAGFLGAALMVLDNIS